MVTYKAPAPPEELTEYQRDFAAWQKFSITTRHRADKLQRYIVDQAYALAATVDIGRNGCLLHNVAYCGVGQTSDWHAHQRERKIARLCIRMMNEAWKFTSLASRASSKAWNAMARKHGMATSEPEPLPVINWHLVFPKETMRRLP